MRTFVREKKTYCGEDYLEVDIFNYTKTEEENAQKGTRSKKEVESTQKQVDWNDINSRRRFLQLVHTNFGEGDIHVSLTYNERNLPPTLEDAERELKNYLRRVAYLRGKKGLPPLKYMAIPTCTYQKDGVTPARIHHHIIMNGGLDRDEIEDLWRKRRERKHKKGEKIGYANADRLQPEENGLAALCEYLAKQAGGKKRWSSSQGLEQPAQETQDQNDVQPEPQPEPTPDPIPAPPPEQAPAVAQTVQKGTSKITASANLNRPWSRTNNHSFSRKEVEKIAKNAPDPAYWERRYPGYTLMGEGYGYKAVYSEARGWALYVKLRRIKR